jgi:hypothetical protein
VGTHPCDKFGAVHFGKGSMKKGCRVAMILGALAIAACDGETSGTVGAGGDAKAAGGTIAGTAKTSDGRPIENFKIAYEGWPEGALGGMDANNRITSPASGSVEGKAGRYEIKVPPGQYTTEADAVVTWHDRPYTFRLETADESDDTARAAVSGSVELTRNYVWKLTGVRRGRDPGAKGSGWERNVHGATIFFDARSTDTKAYKPVRPPLTESDPKGQIEFTLTPVGKLIDGSEGKTLVEKVAVAEDGKYTAGVRGIPTGDYTVSAKLIKEDGTTEPLRLATESASAGADTTFNWREKLDIIFPPEETGPLKYYGTKPVQVYVGK